MPETRPIEVDTWRCYIPGYDLINPNKLMRMHWAARKKAYKNLLHMVVAYGDKPLPKYECQVEIRVTRMWGKRKRAFDIDNLYGGCKLLLDALKTKGGIGIIQDDSPKHTTLRVDQYRSERDDIGGVEVVVKPIDN
tara:strand:+ start:315 stop:722 length:408 start_codon:yes stop_codon:yes gene_type:complete